MDVYQARQEFNIRYYRWACADFEREIEESFPSFRSFKDGSPRKTCQFMQRLNKEQQLALAYALLHRFHPLAVQALGVSCSPEGLTLRSRRDSSSVNDISGFGNQIFTRKCAGEKIKFASRRKLRKAMTTHFIKAFGSECIGLEYVDEWEELEFDMKCCGWIINTSFDFGRTEAQIRYNHAISTRKTFAPAEQQISNGFGLVSMISFNSWLGISSQTEWPYLMDEDIEPTCAAVIERCRHFFEAAPKLLKGLEWESLIQ